LTTNSFEVNGVPTVNTFTITMPVQLKQELELLRGGTIRYNIHMYNIGPINRDTSVMVGEQVHGIYLLGVLQEQFLIQLLMQDHGL
jgi:hypothetical protein